jgi:tetratricopeptide (TPR) repeat protein
MPAVDLLHRLDAPFMDELNLSAFALDFDEGTEPVDDDELIDEEQAAESNRFLACAEAALDELDEAHAMSSLRQALRLDPTNERVAQLLSELCYTGGHARPRAREVTEALEEAAFFQRHRLHGEARETLREALAVAPGDPRLLAKLHRLA